MFANVRQTVADWIFRARAPESPPVTLVQRRIFILPTRQGYLFGLVLLVLLLASINYALSLGFVLTFLLAAMGGVAMLHTWRNLAHLKLRPGRCDPVFAGDTVQFRVVLESPSRERFAVAIRRHEGEPVFVDVRAGEHAMAALPAPTTRRGRLRCGRLEIFTRYPVGLFHAWSYFDFGLAAIVYPRPTQDAGLPPQQSTAGDDEGIPVPGDEDFGSLRPYRAGDAPKLIALKARYQGDLERLAEAARDYGDLEGRLRSPASGLGPVTVNIFLRELRGIWPLATPPLSPLAQLAATHLKLIVPGLSPEEALAALQGAWQAGPAPGRQFADLEAALERLGRAFCRKPASHPCPLGEVCDRNPALMPHRHS